MARKKTYRVPVKFVFEGEFQVEAESASEARDKVNEGCHLVMGQRIEASDDDIVDWEFDMHSEKTIGRVTRERL